MDCDFDIVLLCDDVYVILGLYFRECRIQYTGFVSLPRLNGNKSKETKVHKARTTSRVYCINNSRDISRPPPQLLHRPLDPCAMLPVQQPMDPGK
jgi:hypothetical protein